MLNKLNHNCSTEPVEEPETIDTVTYDSGAEREDKSGKGRMDLVPLDFLADVIEMDLLEQDKNSLESWNINEIIPNLPKKYIAIWVKDDHPSALIYMLIFFEYLKIIKLHGYTPTDKEASYEVLEDYSKHLEDGAEIYGAYNWRKGIPTSVYLSSALRHFAKWCCGMDDEHHDRAFVWNIAGLWWTIKHKPEYNDIDMDTLKDLM